MTSLFAPFDMGLFWSTFIYSIMFCAMIFNYSIVSSMNLSMVTLLVKFLMTFFYSLKPKLFSKSFSLWVLSFFIMMLFLNFSAVWPYIFAPTSQVSMVLFFSLLTWLSLIFIQFCKNLKYFLAHSIPEGTPIYLTWFLFIIELVSNIIRPITLTVRLVANILAGHLLMILLSQLVLKVPLFTFLYLGLNLVEMFVALIQAYIFCTMICLYFSECH